MACSGQLKCIRSIDTSYSVDAGRAYRIRVFWAAVCSVLLLLLTALVLLVWGFQAATLIQPGTVGVAILTLWPAGFAGSLGMLQWHARGWRLRGRLCKGRVGGPMVLLTTAALFLIAFEFSIVFVADYSYLAASWTFLGFNMMFVVLAVNALFEPPASATIEGMLKSGRVAELADRLQDGGTVADSGAAGATGEPLEAGRDAPGRPRRPAAAIDREADKETAAESMSRAKKYYGASVVLLVIYSVVNFLLAEDSHDSGKLLGFATAGTVLVLDLAAGLMYRAKQLHSPGVLCAVMIMSRMGLIAFGARFWLLGTSFVYFTTSLVLAYLAVAQYFAGRLLRKSTASVDGEDDDEAEEGAASSLTAAPSRKGVAVITSPSFWVSPAGVFTILTICFSILLLVVRFAETDSIPMAMVAVFDGSHHQWEFGLAALLGVGVLLSVYSLWLLYETNGRKLGRSGKIAALFVELFIVLSGVMLFIVTDSNIILSLAIFAPPIVVLVAVLYGMWVKADYRLLHGCPRFPSTAHWRFACARIRNADPPGDIDPPEPFSPQQRHDWFVVAIVTSLAVLLLAFAWVFSATVEGSPTWMGWVLTSAFVIFMVCIAPIIQWFNTFEVTIAMVVQLILALALHIIVHAVLWNFYKEDTERTIAVVFSFVLYPTLLLNAVALYRYRDDHWKLSKFVVVCLAVSQVIIVAFIFWAMFAFKGSAAAAGGALVLYLILVGVMAAVIKWITNGYYLPRVWRRVAMVVLGLIVVIGLSMAAYELWVQDDTATAMAYFALPYLASFLALIVSATSMLKRVPAGRLFYSSTVLPVLLYDPDADTLVESNLYFLLVAGAALLAYAWGGAAAIFITPPYLGILVCATTRVALFAYCVDLVRRTQFSFAHALATLQRSEDPDKVALSIVNAVKSAFLKLRAERHSADGEAAGTGDGDRVEDMMPGAEPASHLKDAPVPAPDDVFRLEALVKESDETEAEALRTLLKQARQYFLCCSQEGGCHCLLSRNPPPSDAAGGAPTGDADAGADAGDAPSDSDGDGGAAGAGERKAEDIAIEIDDGDDDEEEGESRLSNSGVVLRLLLSTLDDLDRRVRLAAQEEEYFSHLARMHIIQAGRSEEQVVKVRFQAFLRWCAKQDQQERDNKKRGVVGNTRLAPALFKVTPEGKVRVPVTPRDDVSSHRELLAKWARRYRPREFRAMRDGHASLVEAFEASCAEERAAVARRKAEDEAAERKRREIEEQRRREALELKRREQEAEERRKRELLEAAAREAAEREAAERAREEERRRAEIAAAEERAAEERARIAEDERRAREEADAARRAKRIKEIEAKKRKAAEAAAERKRKIAERTAAAKRAREEQRRKRLAEEEERRKREEIARQRAELIEREQRESDSRARAAGAAAAGGAGGRGGADDDAGLSGRDVALRKVHELRDRYLSRGALYEDDFCGDDALGNSQLVSKNPVWERMTNMAPNPQMTTGGYSPDDIRQGELGDCWLLSAMSVAAMRPEVLDNVLLTKEQNDAGVYAVRLWKNGAWVTIVIDDRFPTKAGCYQKPGEDVLWGGEPDPAAGKYAKPLFVSSRDINEWWMLAIEKAYAKYHGSYAAIEGGWVHTALVDFTGGMPETITLSDEKTAVAVNDGSLWAKLQRYQELGYLLGSGSPAGSDTDISGEGIVQGHAYAVLTMVEESDSRGTHQLIQLRNPWGQTEWNGDWSDDDVVRWTRRMKAKLRYDPKAKEDSNDGIFFMSFRDFCAHYENIYVCRIYKTVDEGGSWYAEHVSDAWIGEKAGGCPNGPTAHKNPQWVFQPSKPCQIVIKLAQGEQLGEGRDPHPIGIKVLSNGGRLCGKPRMGETILKGGFEFSREVVCEGHLTPRDHPYTLFVSTFSAGQTGAFSVTVLTSEPLAPLAGGAKLHLLPPDTEVR